MFDELLRFEIFHGLSTGDMRRLSTIANAHALRAGEYLFLLGDNADSLCLVLSGRIELCFPMNVGGIVKDVTVETLGPGKMLGWSALVRPFRFTLSARAAEAAQIVAFTRQDLLAAFDTNPAIARAVLGSISELVADRLSMFQALWARELQRAVEAGRQAGVR